MSVSPEVQAAVDRIRQQNDLIASMRAADEVRDKQIAELRSKVVDHPSLSDEDKSALKSAIDDMQSTNDALASAVPANAAEAPTAPAPVAGVAPLGHPDHPTEAPTSGDVLAMNGPANHPAGGTVPLMPNMAFDPDPTGARGVGDGGQPNQPAAIETAGGFLVAGGGSTQRAVGSDPASPSSSQVVPLDPDAKAPASTADLVKSGLGDSSQNALLGADGKPIQDGPGMQREPTDADREAAQKQADLVEKERAAREANPLNLAPAGTPQAGSPIVQDGVLVSPVQGQRLDPEGAAPTGHDGDPNQKAPV